MRNERWEIDLLCGGNCACFGKFGTVAYNEARSESWRGAFIVKPIEGPRNCSIQVEASIMTPYPHCAKELRELI